MIDLTALFVTFFAVAAVAVALAVTGLVQVAADRSAARTRTVVQIDVAQPVACGGPPPAPPPPPRAPPPPPPPRAPPPPPPPGPGVCQPERWRASRRSEWIVVIT